MQTNRQINENIEPLMAKNSKKIEITARKSIFALKISVVDENALEFFGNYRGVPKDDKFVIIPTGRAFECIR